jgi:adenosine deaminase
VLELARQFLGSGVVGIDLCGDPAQVDIAHLAPVFEEARQVPGLGMTLHFAEAESSGSDDELDLMLSWKPDRIWHVICLSDRGKGENMKSGGMGRELCLRCKVHMGMVCGGFEGQYVFFFFFLSLSLLGV